MQTNINQIERVKTRQQIDAVYIAHPVMPVEVAIAGDEVSILTGKSGSQAQMLLDDFAVILSAVIEAGVDVGQLADRLGSVDARDAPVTRRILEVMKQSQGGRNE